MDMKYTERQRHREMRETDMETGRERDKDRRDTSKDKVRQRQT